MCCTPCAFAACGVAATERTGSLSGKGCRHCEASWRTWAWPAPALRPRRGARPSTLPAPPCSAACPDPPRLGSSSARSAQRCADWPPGTQKTEPEERAARLEATISAALTIERLECRSRRNACAHLFLWRDLFPHRGDNVHDLVARPPVVLRRHERLVAREEDQVRVLRALGLRRLRAVLAATTWWRGLCGGRRQRGPAGTHILIWGTISPVEPCTTTSSRSRDRARCGQNARCVRGDLDSAAGLPASGLGERRPRSRRHGARRRHAEEHFIAV